MTCLHGKTLGVQNNLAPTVSPFVVLWWMEVCVPWANCLAKQQREIGWITDYFCRGTCLRIKSIDMPLGQQQYWTIKKLRNAAWQHCFLCVCLKQTADFIWLRCPILGTRNGRSSLERSYFCLAGHDVPLPSIGHPLLHPLMPRFGGFRVWRQGKNYMVSDHDVSGS